MRLATLLALLLASAAPAAPAWGQPPSTPLNAPASDAATATAVGTGVAASPDDDLPDNNDVTDGTDNTDVGLLQVELGGAFTRTDGTSHAQGTPITLRYGAFEWLELSVGTDGYTWQRAADPATAQGLGNLQVGARLRFFAKPGGPPILAFIPQVTLPTASPAKGLGTGDRDMTLAVITGHDLPHQAHVDVSYGAGSIGEGAGLGRFAQQIAFVSGSLGVTKAWTPGLTFTWVSRQDVATGRAFTLSTDSAITLSRRMALDLSIVFGLTPQSPDFGVAAGMSFVLGTLDEDDGVHVRRHKLRLRSKRRPTTVK